MGQICRLIADLRAADAAFSAYATGHAGCFMMDHASLAEGPDGLRPLFDFLGKPMDRAAVAGVLAQRLTHGSAEAVLGAKAG